MNKSLLLVILVCLLLIGVGFIVFHYKRNKIVATAPKNLIGLLGIKSNGTDRSISPVLQEKINSYRKPGSTKPLKATPIWELIRISESEAGETAKFKQARVVRVINAPFDYEVELLATGKHKVISISPEMDFFVPEYQYDEGGNIKTAAFSSVDRGDILTVLEEGSLILLYAQKNKDAVNVNNDSDQIEIEWFVLAD